MENKPSPPHETTDANTVPVWITGALLVISCLLIGWAVVVMFDHMKHQTDAEDRDEAKTHVTSSVAGSRPQFPGPQLQVAPAKDLATLRAREEAELTQYGWIDKQAGVVRIPIERAMELTIQRGLPVQGQPGVPAPYRAILDLQQARPLERETPIPSPTQ
jgi:hypothetical protein